MAGPKTVENDQFARTSTALGTKTTPSIGPDQGISPLADNDGRLIVRLAGAGGFLPDPTSNPFIFSGTYVPVAGSIINPAPTLFFGSVGYNDNIGPVYLQYFNSVALPVAGVTVPTLTFLLGAGPSFYIPEQLSEMSVSFPVGLVIAGSTTQFVFTPLATPSIYIGNSFI